MKKAGLFACVALLYGMANSQPSPTSLMAPYRVPASEDVRNNGMGGTGVVGTQGANAIFTNPALLGALDKTSIQVGSRMTLGFISDKYYEYMAQQAGLTFSESHPLHIKLTNISFAIPFVIPNSPVTLSAGIGYNTAYDLGFSINYSDVSETDKYRFHGGINVLSPALAIGIMDKFFAGFAINSTILRRLKN